LLLGEKISARHALSWGLLTRVFPDADFESRPGEFTGRLATMPTGAIGANKKLLNYGLQNELADSLEVEARELLETIRSADNQERVRAFLEKRPPRFTGR
jgi:2-(1,2-epoxy-1,2-dihydrophenyl)acetyl-CoA isomerase